MIEIEKLIKLFSYFFAEIRKLFSGTYNKPIFDLKKWPQIWTCTVFEAHPQNCLTRYQKIVRYNFSSIFACHTIKFCNSIAQVETAYQNFSHIWREVVGFPRWFFVVCRAMTIFLRSLTISSVAAPWRRHEIGFCR